MTTAETIAAALAPVLELPHRVAEMEARLARIEEALRPRALPTAMRSPDDLLSTEEAAREAGVTPATIREWVRERRIEGHRAPGSRRVRLRRGTLAAFLRGESGGGDDIEETATRLLMVPSAAAAARPMPVATSASSRRKT